MAARPSEHPATSVLVLEGRADYRSAETLQAIRSLHWLDALSALVRTGLARFADSAEALGYQLCQIGPDGQAGAGKAFGGLGFPAILRAE